MNVNRKVTLDDLEIIDMITAQNEKTSRLLNNSQHGPAMHHHITRNNSNPKNLTIRTSFTTSPLAYEEYLQQNIHHYDGNEHIHDQSGMVSPLKLGGAAVSPVKQTRPWLNELKFLLLHN